ncbi:unnamed protein product, partial [Mesorhabditis belari]|uniref:Uncharacterized protein n=1 Tax=Mesorhabditis belari TaxID=2138241 RepID=A0AAF3FJQ7_9BILA
MLQKAVLDSDWKTMNDCPTNSKKCRSEEPLFKLTSRDGSLFYVSAKAAKLSGLIRRFVEIYDLNDEQAIFMMEPIHLPNVNYRVLTMIIHWTESHKNCPKWIEEKWWLNKKKPLLNSWESGFFKEMPNDFLYKLFVAADYMDVKCLLDACAEKIADQGRGKNEEEMRQVWGLPNDLGPDYGFKRETTFWEDILQGQEHRARVKNEQNCVKAKQKAHQ